jgi:hypothetical protein
MFRSRSHARRAKAAVADDPEERRMAICPVCRSEYRKEYTHCATCDVDLVDPADLPSELTDDEVAATMAEEENLVTVLHGSVDACKEMQRKLRAVRIPSIARRVRDTVAEAGHHLILEVCVRTADAERTGELFQRELIEKLAQDGLLDDAVEIQQRKNHKAEKKKRQEAAGGETPGGPEAGAGEAQPEDDPDEPIPCPACGCTKPLKKGVCRKCGLVLGE